MNTFETVAARMLAREGIWELHVRAAASYGGATGYRLFLLLA